MSDTTVNVESVESTEAPTAEATPQAGAEAAAPQAEATESSNELSYEDAIKALKEARSEAAANRVKARELEKKFEGAKTAEEFQAVLDGVRSEREAAERALILENVALKAGLPKEIADRITGSSREEMEADAAKLAALFGSSLSGEPSGGLDPRGGQAEDTRTPEEIASQYGRRQYR